MSRWEFMRQLEELLSDISPNEREEALQYYNDYFNDAGKENEQEVIKALGSPAQVAGIVRDGLSDSENLGEFTESGFKSSSARPQNAIVKRASEKSSHTGSEKQTENMRRNVDEQKTDGQRESSTDAGSQRAENHNAENAHVDPVSSESGYASGGTASKEGMPVWATVLIVIGCVFLSPVIIGLAASVLAAIVSLFVALFSIILGIGIAMIALFIVAFALVSAGFGTIFPHPVTGMGLIGGGCICAALAILFMLLLVFLLGKCIPGICQGIAYIFKKLFGKKGGEAV